MLNQFTNIQHKSLELLLIDSTEKKDFPSVYKKEFKDVSFDISGGYIIISETKKDSIIASVFNLMNVSGYKLKK